MRTSHRSIPYLAGRVGAKLAERINIMASVHVHHRKITGQLADALTVRRSRTKLGMSDYLCQGMFDRNVFPEGGLERCGGWWFKERIHERLNGLAWEGMVTDKLMLYGLFEQFGLPHPTVQAAAWERARSYGNVPVFHDPGSLAAFLAGSEVRYPLFCKPVKGSYGRGAFRLEAYEKASGQLLFSDGRRMEPLAFLSLLEDDGWGFLFQDAVRPAPETFPICGRSVSGCRVAMLLGDEGAWPYRVVWKIPSAGNHSDNWGNGTRGTMLAAVDVQTGRVARVVSGKGVAMRVNAPHPDTGFDVLGTRVPYWEEMITLMKRASECFPGFRWQNWDVGFSDRGPILYELNSAGHIDILQIAYGKGVDDRELNAFLEKYARRPESAPEQLF